MPAQPVRDLVISSVYKNDDPFKAEIDEVSKKKYTEQTRLLYRLETSLVKKSNSYLASGNRQVAECVLNWLYQWAFADAFLGKTNAQGVYVRQWSLASFSSAYLQPGSRFPPLE